MIELEWVVWLPNQYSIIMKSIVIFLAVFIAQTSYSQSIVSVSPNVVAPGTITSTISFEGNLTFWNTGAGLYQIVLAGPNDTIWPASQNIIDDTHAEATYLIPTSADTGCYDVRAFDLIADTVWLFCGMTVSNSAGVDNLSQSNRVSIFPNPLQETSTFEISLPENEECTIEFYDASGRKTKTITTLETQVLLKRNQFDAGIYIYTLSNAKGILGQGRLIVE